MKRRDCTYVCIYCILYQGPTCNGRILVFFPLFSDALWFYKIVIYLISCLTSTPPPHPIQLLIFGKYTSKVNSKGYYNLGGEEEKNEAAVYNFIAVVILFKKQNKYLWNVFLKRKVKKMLLVIFSSLKTHLSFWPRQAMYTLHWSSTKMKKCWVP